MASGDNDAEAPALVIKRKADPDIARRASLAVMLAAVLAAAI